MAPKAGTKANRPPTGSNELDDPDRKATAAFPPRHMVRNDHHRTLAEKGAASAEAAE